jgi:hypothetical protein
MSGQALKCQVCLYNLHGQNCLAYVEARLRYGTFGPHSMQLPRLIIYFVMIVRICLF